MLEWYCQAAMQTWQPLACGTGGASKEPNEQALHKVSACLSMVTSVLHSEEKYGSCM